LKEMLQARSFYRAMTAAQRQDLEEAVAEDIFFLDSRLQERITALIGEADVQLAENIRRRNDFTT
jgi:catalase